MLKTIIEKWIGEEQEIRLNNSSIVDYAQEIAQNKVIINLKSRIPELEEMIVEIYKQRIEKYRNTTTLSTKTAIALIAEYEYLINTLKGDKE